MIWEKITFFLFLSISLTRVLASEMIVSPDRKYSVTENANDTNVVILRCIISSEN